MSLNVGDVNVNTEKDWVVPTEEAYFADEQERLNTVRKLRIPKIPNYMKSTIAFTAKKSQNAILKSERKEKDTQTKTERRKMAVPRGGRIMAAIKANAIEGNSRASPVKPFVRINKIGEWQSMAINDPKTFENKTKIRAKKPVLNTFNEHTNKNTTSSKVLSESLDDSKDSLSNAKYKTIRRRMESLSKDKKRTIAAVVKSPRKNPTVIKNVKAPEITPCVEKCKPKTRYNKNKNEKEVLERQMPSAANAIGNDKTFQSVPKSTPKTKIFSKRGNTEGLMDQAQFCDKETGTFIVHRNKETLRIPLNQQKIIKKDDRNSKVTSRVQKTSKTKGGMEEHAVWDRVKKEKRIPIAEIGDSQSIKLSSVPEEVDDVDVAKEADLKKIADKRFLEPPKCHGDGTSMCGDAQQSDSGDTQPDDGIPVQKVSSARFPNSENLMEQDEISEKSSLLISSITLTSFLGAMPPTTVNDSYIFNTMLAANSGDNVVPKGLNFLNNKLNTKDDVQPNLPGRNMNLLQLQEKFAKLGEVFPNMENNKYVVDPPVVDSQKVHPKSLVKYCAKTKEVIPEKNVKQIKSKPTPLPRVAMLYKKKSPSAVADLSKRKGSAVKSTRITSLPRSSKTTLTASRSKASAAIPDMSLAILEAVKKPQKKITVKKSKRAKSVPSEGVVKSTPSKPKVSASESSPRVPKIVMKRKKKTTRKKSRKPMPFVEENRNRSRDVLLFKSQFYLFAKFGDRRNSGETISMANTVRWLKQADIISKKRVTTNDAEIYFIHTTQRRRSLRLIEFIQFIRTLCCEKGLNTTKVMESLMKCGKPEISVTDLTIASVLAEEADVPNIVKEFETPLVSPQTAAIVDNPYKSSMYASRLRKQHLPNAGDVNPQQNYHGIPFPIPASYFQSPPEVGPIYHFTSQSQSSGKEVGSQGKTKRRGSTDLDTKEPNRISKQVTETSHRKERKKKKAVHSERKSKKNKKSPREENKSQKKPNKDLPNADVENGGYNDKIKVRHLRSEDLIPRPEVQSHPSPENWDEPDLAEISLDTDGFYPEEIYMFESCSEGENDSEKMSSQMGDVYIAIEDSSLRIPKDSIALSNPYSGINTDNNVQKKRRSRKNHNVQTWIESIDVSQAESTE